MSAALENARELISSEARARVDIRLSEGHGFDDPHAALAGVTMLAGNVGGGVQKRLVKALKNGPVDVAPGGVQNGAEPFVPLLDDGVRKPAR